MKRPYILFLLLFGLCLRGSAQTYLEMPSSTAYASGTTYTKGDIIQSAGATYISLIVGNTGNTPVSSPADWLAIGSGTSGTSSGYLSAAAPTVTTLGANTNLLGYTNNLATYWNVMWMATATDGQSDETGGSTASLFIPNTTNVTHQIAWSPNSQAGSSDQATVTSVYAKPDGDNYAYIQLFIKNTGPFHYLGGWFNISSCTTVSNDSGITVTATAASNGYCLIQIGYTLPAKYAISRVQIGVAPTSSTGTFVGDGTSGGYLSHPQLTFTSTLQSYQPETGKHHYCVAAYDSSGTTGGCSPWVVAPMETNTIVMPFVTSSSYCKVFRTGGFTQGALTVSGSTHVACGGTVTDNLLGADGTTAPVPALGTIDTRPLNYQITESIHVAPYQFLRLFTADAGLSGTVTSIHVTFQTPDPDNFLIVVRCNGSGAPAETVDLGTFMMAEDIPTNPVMLKNFGIGATGIGGAWSSTRSVEIPFSSGCQIDLDNNTAATFTDVFADIAYRPGPRIVNPLRTKWHANLTTLTSVSPYTVVNLLPTVTSTGGGELESVTLFTDPPTSDLGYIEGDPFVYVDGAVGVTSNGTEDFFGSGYAYNFQTASVQSDHWGDWLGAALSSKKNTSDILQYRFFGGVDPAFAVPFTSSLQVTWENGQVGEGGSIAAINYKALVTYWTAQ
jgi:hypothetical protein